VRLARACWSIIFCRFKQQQKKLTNFFNANYGTNCKMQIITIAQTTETGQLFALTDERPTCIDVMSSTENSYSIASIKRV